MSVRLPQILAVEQVPCFFPPAGTQRLYNVSFRAYLRYVIYERLRNVVTTFVNERCFTYV